MENDNSFEKHILSAEKAVLKNKEIVQKNNLNKYLKNENDDDKDNEIKEE